MVSKSNFDYNDQLGAVIRTLDREVEQNTELIEALKALYDVQRGLPTPEVEVAWGRAMERAADLIARHTGRRQS